MTQCDRFSLGAGEDNPTNRSATPTSSSPLSPKNPVKPTESMAVGRHLIIVMVLSGYQC
ncbi:hypothetical protein Hanom_Chr14g01317951 [Helianthus anomalus]